MDVSELAEELKRSTMERLPWHAGGSLITSIAQGMEVAMARDETDSPRGRTSNLNDMIYEMNDFYLDMVHKLRDLKNEAAGDAEEDDCSVLSEVVSAIEKQRNDPDVKKQIEAILKLDVELERSYDILRSEKTERQNMEEEYCQLLESQHLIGKDSEFLELCKLDSNEKSPGVLEVSGAAGDATRKKKNQSDNDKFIKRNIELAKNANMMAGFSMTDEDKLKLETLLKDVDTMQFEIGDDSITERIEVEDGEETAYEFNEEETLRLEELEAKLEEFMVSKEHLNFEDIERDAKEHKYWKNEKRLAHIEEELRNIEIENESAPSLKTNEEEDVALDEKKIVESYTSSLCFNSDDDDL